MDVPLVSIGRSIAFFGGGSEKYFPHLYLVQDIFWWSIAYGRTVFNIKEEDLDRRKKVLDLPPPIMGSPRTISSPAVSAEHVTLLSA